MSVLTQIRNWFNLGTEEIEDVGLDALTVEDVNEDIEVDGSSQDAASTETVEDSEVEN